MATVKKHQRKDYQKKDINRQDVITMEYVLEHEKTL
jgi:hypothetical protein